MKKQLLGPKHEWARLHGLDQVILGFHVNRTRAVAPALRRCRVALRRYGAALENQENHPEADDKVLNDVKKHHDEDNREVRGGEEKEIARHRRYGVEAEHEIRRRIGVVPHVDEFGGQELKAQLYAYPHGRDERLMKRAQLREEGAVEAKNGRESDWQQ